MFHIMASKYAEDDMFLNYGKESKCLECEKLKIKLERKVGLKQNTIDKLQREVKSWSKAHWDLVGINCKLKDQVNTLSKLID